MAFCFSEKKITKKGLRCIIYYNSEKFFYVRKFKYIQNNGEKDEDGFITILLYGSIGYEYDAFGTPIDGIDGACFANELLNICEYYPEIKGVKLRINSYGGNVIDGFSIISSILETQKKIPVNTYVDGMAYSIAALIAVMGNERCMKDFATIMLHNPTGPENMIALIKNSLEIVLENNTTLSSKKLFQMMDDETYFASKDVTLNGTKYMSAVKAGLVDEVETSGRVVNVTKDIREMFNVYNNALVTEKQNKMLEENKQNENEIKVVLDSTELDKTIELLNSKLSTAENAVKELETKLAIIEELENAKKENEILEMVNSFVKEGAIKDSEKDSTIKLARVDFEGMKNMLSKINSNKITPIFDFSKPVLENNGADNISWDYEKWATTNSKGLNEMRISNPERHQNLLDAHLEKLRSKKTK